MTLGRSVRFDCFYLLGSLFREVSHEGYCRQNPSPRVFSCARIAYTLLPCLPPFAFSVAILDSCHPTFDVNRGYEFHSVVSFLYFCSEKPPVLGSSRAVVWKKPCQGAVCFNRLKGERFYFPNSPALPMFPRLFPRKKKQRPIVSKRKR